MTDLKRRGVPPSMLRAVPEDGKLKPIMAIETRPSPLTGIGWWVVLAYKEHHFEEMLPPDFPAMDETMRNLTILPVAERLRLKLKPILEAEDANP